MKDKEEQPSLSIPPTQPLRNHDPSTACTTPHPSQQTIGELLFNTPDIQSGAFHPLFPQFHVPTNGSNTNPDSFSHHRSHDHCHHEIPHLHRHVESDEEVMSDDYDTSCGPDSEARHFDGVCQAFSNYAFDSMKEISRIERHFHTLSKDDELLLMESIDERIENMKNAVITNQNFLNLILIDQGRFNDDDDDDRTCNSQQLNQKQSSKEKDSFGEINEQQKPIPEIKIELDEDLPKRNQLELNQQRNSSQPNDIDFLCPEKQRQNVMGRLPTAVRNISKVRSTLRQFVRDWSHEGKQERDASYEPLINALEENLNLAEFKAKHGRTPRILCPGSGLGRLPFEVVRRGYACQGNEFSYFMLLGSNLILNCNIPTESCVIQPYCLSTSNRICQMDHLTEIRIPDVSPVDIADSDQDFSMCAGEFVEVYWEQKGEWDGLLTCFFIDTAKNILQYIRTIARILRSGGLWANLGPLLYHFSDMPNEISIELSWEELRRGMMVLTSDAY